MPPVAVSLVVQLPHQKDRLVPTVRWVDLQDLPYPDYQVIYVDHHGGDSERLMELAARRPNVAVIGADDAESAVDRAEGDYVLVVGGEDRLQPWALPTLLDRARETAADLVLGRSTGIGPIGFAPEVLRRPWQLGDPDAAIAALAPIALIRTELLRTVRDAAPVADRWRTQRIRALQSTRRAEVVSDVPVATGPGLGAGESPDEVWADVDDAAALIADPHARAAFVAAHVTATLRRTPEADLAGRISEVVRRQVDSTELADWSALLNGSPAETIAAAANRVRPKVSCHTARWEDGRLRLSLTVDVQPIGESAPEALLARVTPDLLLRHPGSSVVYPVTISARQTSDDPNTPSFAVDAAIDPATAAAGAELVRGQWILMVRLLGTDSDAPATANVPFTDPGPAIVDGVPIRAYAENGGFRIDVGAGKHGIFGDSAPEDATVTESAAGSLLTVNLPRIAVRGESHLPGHLLFGTFGLPSVLITDEANARLECYISGLASVSALSGRYRPAADQALGLQLRIGPAGDISIERAEPKPAQAAQPASSPKPTAKKSATKTSSAKKPAAKTSGPAASSSPGAKRATGATAHTYPSSEPSALQQLAMTLKPAGAYLPKPIRRRARKVYRKLVR